MKPSEPEVPPEPLFEPKALPSGPHCYSNQRVYDLELLVAEVRSLADLEDNWDSYGATAPSQRAIDDAIAILCDYSLCTSSTGWVTFGLPWYPSASTL
jgi:hypothetical protein